MDALEEQPKPGRPYLPKIVMKYDFARSNKEFKRLWVKTHKTTAGLKDQPRYPVRVFTPRVRFLEEHIRRINRLSKLLDKLRPSKGSILWMPKVVMPSKAPVSKPVSRPPKPVRQKNLAVKPLQRLDEETEVFSFVGGTTHVYHPNKPPPKKEWTKYWYFYRTRKRWKPSEHHPLGDEILTLPVT